MTLCIYMNVSNAIAPIPSTLAMLNKYNKMLCPLLNFSQSDYLIQVVHTNSHS